jgi:hypothetical protein
VMSVDAGWCRRSGVSAVEEIRRSGQTAHVFISGDAESIRVRRPKAIVVRKPFGGPNSPRPSETRSMWHAPQGSKSIAARGTTTDKSCPVILRMLSPGHQAAAPAPYSHPGGRRRREPGTVV